MLGGSVENIFGSGNQQGGHPRLVGADIVEKMRVLPERIDVVGIVPGRLVVAEEQDHAVRKRVTKSAPAAREGGRIHKTASISMGIMAYPTGRRPDPASE
jgi:hypothetical protein